MIDATVRLVAAREVRVRTRSKGFKIATVLSVLAVAGLIVLPRLLASTPTYRVGVVGEVPAAAPENLRRLAGFVGADVEMVPLTSVDDAVVGVGEATLDLAILGPDEILIQEAVTPDDIGRLARFASAIAADLGLHAGLEAAGLSPDAAAASLRSPPVPIRSLEPPRPDEERNRITAYVGSVALLMLIMQYGSWILYGVAEEKSSRVVEVLLATVRPSHLLVGKVLGIGLVALLQASILALTALGVAGASGSDILDGTGAGVIAAAFLWFALGYAFYCGVYAAAGSLVGRQEEVSSVGFPLQLPLFVAFLASTTSLEGDESALVRVLSFLPPTAPIAMPVRVGIGSAGLWEVLASAAITVAATIGVFRLAAVVYQRSLLRTGRRVRLKDVLGRSVT